MSSQPPNPDLAAQKELLRKLGRETIYTSKAHFKARDLRRKLVSGTIWTCVLLSLAGIFSINEYVDKGISVAGLFGTIALLIWNEGDGKNYKERHRDAAEKYLALHKEIRTQFLLPGADQDAAAGLAARVSQLDQSDKPDIPDIAWKLAKRAIEKEKPETDNWFLAPYPAAGTSAAVSGGTAASSGERV